jgi:hypothetical protein
MRRVSGDKPSQKASDIMRELASVWKTLDADQKQKYSKQLAA